MFIHSIIISFLSCQPIIVSTFLYSNIIPTKLSWAESWQLISSVKATTKLSTSTTKNEQVKKLSKEAQELLDAIQSKEEDGGNTRPHLSLVIAQIAPSVRVAIPEVFGREPGTLPTGQLVTSLRQIGFDLVLDTNTGADITICEEGTELLHRMEATIAQRRRSRLNKQKQHPNNDTGDNKKKDDEMITKEPAHLPLFTSCCPGWLNYVEKSAPELIPYVSTCKSPHMMYGAIVKEYSQDMFSIPPEEIYLCSIMPCVRKRGESDHDAFIHNDIRDVDNVITTKDLGMILELKKIDPYTLESSNFDSPFQKDCSSSKNRVVEGMGIGSGAGQLFGTTGGVMEAAVRTVYELMTGKEMERLELEEVRGLDGVKEATIPELDLHVAVANGLGNAKKLLQKITKTISESNNKDDNDHEEEVVPSYDFVEVMACPGGCIGGGGQPPPQVSSSSTNKKESTLHKRMECIYKLDRSLPRRKSHNNPIVKRIYSDDYLGYYGSEKAHEILHVDPIYGGERSNDDDDSDRHHHH